MSPKTSTADSGTAGTRQLNATVTPDDATDKTVSYTSDLEVSDTGLLSWSDDTPAGVYTTTVTAGNQTDTHTLTLNAPPEGE